MKESTRRYIKHLNDAYDTMSTLQGDPAFDHNSELACTADECMTNISDIIDMLFNEDP